MSVDSIIASARFELPESYLSILRSGDSASVSFEGKVWKLASVDDLASEQRFSSGRVPFWEMGKAIVADIDSSGICETNELAAAIPASSLALCFCIASDNSDLLVLDPDGAVWGFWHSSLEFHKISKTFADVYDIAIPPVRIDSDSRIVGAWKPVSSSSDKMDFVRDIFPQYDFLDDGRVVMTYGDGEVEKGDWEFLENDGDDRNLISAGGEKIFVEFISDTEFSYTNEDRDLQITYSKEEC